MGLGIMDPTSVPAGQANMTTPLDFLAFDVIGWDLSSEIPEAGALILLTAGLAAVALARRRYSNS